MNKKIILSVAAAATIALTMTGCGSSGGDDDGSSLSGVAVKADLNGSTVSAGGETTTTDSSGKWSFNGNFPAGTPFVSVSGGNYNDGYVGGNPHYADNNVTLTATTAQINAGLEVSMLTKLINEFDGNITKAGNVLGLDLPAGANVSYLARNIHAADFETRAVQIAAILGNSSNVTQTLASLEGNATSKLSLLQLKAIAPGLTTALDAMEEGNYAKGNMLAADQNVTGIDFGANNVIDVNGSMSTVDGGTTNVTMDYKGSAITSTSTSMDNNQTAVMFKLVDANSTLTNVNGNTSLYVSLSGLDAANANSSYVMGLTGITTTDTSGVLTLTYTSNGTLATYANSNVSYSTSADSNASVLQGSSSFLSATSGYNVVNVARFKKYMDSIYASSNSNTSSIGYFTNGMNSGNYSLKVYVNIADQNMTTNSRVTKLVSNGMQTTTDSGTTLFSGAKAYKVLDANLSY
jgi:hypothetical protein